MLCITRMQRSCYTLSSKASIKVVNHDLPVIRKESFNSIFPLCSVHFLFIFLILFYLIQCNLTKKMKVHCKNLGLYVKGGIVR